MWIPICWHNTLNESDELWLIELHNSNTTGIRTWATRSGNRCTNHSTTAPHKNDSGIAFPICILLRSTLTVAHISSLLAVSMMGPPPPVVEWNPMPYTCSISLSPLYPSLTIDLHVRIAADLHQSFLWLRYWNCQIDSPVPLNASLLNNQCWNTYENT